MKKTILSIILISLGVVAVAQPKSGQKQDDRRYEERRQDDRRYVAPAPSKNTHYQQAKPVVLQQGKHNPQPSGKPVVVVQSKPKPNSVRFEVKRPKPRPSFGDVLVRALIPPPSRAVVVVHSSVTPVFEMEQLDRQPELIQSPSINYPENMANAGIEGEVTMMVQIDKDGYVGLEQVVSSTNTEFEKEAIASLGTFRYEQPLKNGRRVNARFSLTIPFVLSE